MLEILFRVFAVLGLIGFLLWFLFIVLILCKAGSDND